MNFHLAFIGHPAFKKMGAKQAYSIANGIAFLPLCFFGINALLLSIIAIVSVNPIIVCHFRKSLFFSYLETLLRSSLDLSFALILFL
jgi:hypothetical protein